MNKIAAYFYDLCVTYGALIKDGEMDRIKNHIKAIFEYFFTVVSKYQSEILKDSQCYITTIDFILAREVDFGFSEQEIALFKEMKAYIEQGSLDFENIFKKYENIEGSFFNSLDSKITKLLIKLNNKKSNEYIALRNLEYLLKRFREFNVYKYVDELKFEIINVIIFCYGTNFYINKKYDKFLYSYFNNMYTSKLAKLCTKLPSGSESTITDMIEDLVIKSIDNTISNDSDKLEKTFKNLRLLYKKSGLYNVCVSSIEIYADLKDKDEKFILDLIRMSIFITSHDVENTGYVSELNPYQVDNIEELDTVRRKKTSDELYSHAFIIDVGHKNFDISKSLELIEKRLEALKIEFLLISDKNLDSRLLSQYDSRGQKTLKSVVLDFLSWYYVDCIGKMSQAEFIRWYYNSSNPREFASTVTKARKAMGEAIEVKYQKIEKLKPPKPDKADEQKWQ